jgi:hypothetical protein
MPIIEAWSWDDDNLNHLQPPRPNRRTIRQVAAEDPRFRRNRRGRAASHQMVGPDEGGTMWVVCIVEVSTNPGTWRAITGWRARDPEIEWYRRSR